MNTEETILKLASEKGKFTTADVLVVLKNQISRQAVSMAVNKLVKEGKLMKGGSTRGAYYVSPKYMESSTSGECVEMYLENINLKEHEVLMDIKNKSPFIKTLKDNIFSIFEYGFDEMLNNAIEHSQTKNIELKVCKNEDNVSFTITDFGVGVFKNIMQKKELKSELEAIQDLLKGKTTTVPKSHSGEGIFFTSKAVDIFILESFGLRLRIDNIINDIFVEEIKPGKDGTKVICVISLKTIKHLQEVFEKYETKSEDGRAFDKTEVFVRLFTAGTIFISRSQARRVLVGLEKFKTIILDFDRVSTIGQAFADEIFRVFKIKYPDIQIIPKNMNKAVEFMVERVEKV